MRFFNTEGPVRPDKHVVPRELGYILQSSLDVQMAWYVDDDGSLNMMKLLTAFPGN